MIGLLAMAGDDPISSNRPQLNSARATTPPKIDGSIEPLEWQSADAETIISQDARSLCVVYALNDDKRVYLAFSAVDDVTDATGRTPRAVFDNVAVWFAGEIGYWLYGDGKLRTDALDPKSHESWHFPSSADAAVGGPPDEPHMMYELVVPLSEIGIEAGKSVSIGLHYRDDHDGGPTFWWPSGVDVFTPSSFGILVTSRKQ